MPEPIAPSVAIVGGGIAGLMAARALVDDAASVKITLIERNDYWGGRIQKAAAIGSKSGDAKQHYLELGAETVHGGRTPLTELIAELFPSDVLEDIFIVSHADGGPSSQPTATTGECGVYYMNGTVYHFDDERLRPLRKALDGIGVDKCTNMDPNVSVGDYLSSSLDDDALGSLAVASFGNTVGCTDLSLISLSMWARFEAWWEENEEEGDFHFSRGMHSIVERLVEELEVPANDAVVSLQRDTEVVEISEASAGQVQLVLRPLTSQTCANTITATFDAVIVTVPPHRWPRLLPDLMTPAKREAVEFVGMEIATKVIIAFRNRVWPGNISCLVSADHLIPELWFRELEPNALYVAVGFLTSGAAKAFDDAIKRDLDESIDDFEVRWKHRATEIVVTQLSEIFGTSREAAFHQVISSGTRLFTWDDGGYMYPKVGMQPHHFHAMAAPTKHVFFSGEATHAGACMTVQAAISSGSRAAQEVLACLQST